jgi:hypothetical protein
MEAETVCPACGLTVSRDCEDAECPFRIGVDDDD